MFSLDHAQSMKLNDWKILHKVECEFEDSMRQGAIGGRWTYCFMPTGLEIVVKVKCACGAEVDITDYNNW